MLIIVITEVQFLLFCFFTKRFYIIYFYNNRINSPKLSAISPVVRILNQQRRGLITQQEADAQINPLRSLDIRNSYLKDFYNPAVNQQYALSISGGSASHAWLIAGGYDQNLSELSALYKRGTLRIDNT